MHEFARFNLIYGWNGTGKTTLSNLFRALERRELPADVDVAFGSTAGDIAAQDLPHSPVAVRVFNREFVGESVFSVEGNRVAPILVIGKESVDKQKEVEALREQLRKTNEDLVRSKAEDSGARKALDKHCIEKASMIREVLRSSGANPYNRYDKSGYRACASSVVAKGSRDVCLLDGFDRDRMLARHRASPKPAIRLIAWEPPDFATLLKDAKRLLSTTVRSSVIEMLRDDPVLSAWLRDGLALHGQRAADECLFCSQGLPSSRLAALEGHFSAEYAPMLHSRGERSSWIRGSLPELVTDSRAG